MGTSWGEGHGYLRCGSAKLGCPVRDQHGPGRRAWGTHSEGSVNPGCIRNCPELTVLQGAFWQENGRLGGPLCTDIERVDCPTLGSDLLLTDDYFSGRQYDDIRVALSKSRREVGTF